MLFLYSLYLTTKYFCYSAHYWHVVSS